MRRLSVLLPLLALAPGCQSKPSGADVLSAMSGATASSAARVRDGLVYAEVQFQNGRKGEATGLLLGEEGVFLFPFRIEKDKVQRARAWYRQQEWPAEYVKDDDRLGVTLFRLPPSAKPFVPAATSAAVPAVGDWVVAVSASGKDSDFQVFARLGMVMGTLKQEVDRLVLSETGHPPGAVLAGLDGALVGLMQGNDAVVLSDVLKRLGPSLLSRPGSAAGAVASADDKGKPWIGVMLDPINEEYAELAGLPKEAVWITQAFDGAPARKCGLEEGDLIVKVDGQTLGASGPRALPRLMKLFSPQVGREVTVEALRGGKPVTARCRFEKAPEPKELKADDLGLQVQEITESVYHLNAGLYCREGMLVTDVVRGGPAAAGQGLVGKGDAILSLEGRPTPTLEAFSEALDALRRSGSKQALLKIQRGIRVTYAALNLSLHQKGEAK